MMSLSSAVTRRTPSLRGEAEAIQPVFWPVAVWIASASPRNDGEERAHAVCMREMGYFNTRPATASNFARSAGSRLSGAVISAKSREWSEPIGQAGCSAGKAAAKRATN